MWKLAFSLVAAGLLVTAGSAGASVVNGAVTGGQVLSAGGTFTLLTTATPFAVGKDTFQTPNLYAFDEDQNVTISAPLAVDIGTAPVAGDTISSHYVFFDPFRFVTQVGYVDFDAPILGVATRFGTLAASDYLGAANVTYLRPALRGLESLTDTVMIDPTNPYRLLISWWAGTPGDYIRVFTEATPVPLPAALPLLLAGLGGLTLTRRRVSR